MEQIIINNEREFIYSLEEIEKGLSETMSLTENPARYYAALSGRLQAHYKALYEYVKRLEANQSKQ